MAKGLEQCKSGKDLIHYAEHHGGYVDRQSGSHVIVKGPTGATCPVPNHPGDMPTGTRHSIVKRFLLIGITVFIFFFVVMPLLRAYIEIGL